MHIPNVLRASWGLALVLIISHLLSARAAATQFGTARANITPDVPIRLSGYAVRTTEAQAVQHDIFATAAAFGEGAETALLITVDATGIPSNVADSVIASLSQQLSLPAERINITSSHTHHGPSVSGYLTNLFSGPLPAAQQQRIDSYTQTLTAELEQVGLAAVANQTPGHTLSWGSGNVDFGMNRRGAGIVDHALPVMRVADSSGATTAIITSYASHAVALDLATNEVDGDWPGFARDAIEARFPGAMALVMIGAAGDINPAPMGSLTAAQSHGNSIANEIGRLVDNNLLTPVSQQIRANHGEINLPYATQLVSGDPGNARLAAPGTLDHQYGITTWAFGDQLAMVFLEGEVVVDYSLRLRNERNDGRLWLNAYSNDVQGYIPSERILFEGGYEADSSGFYYATPGRFAHGVENRVVDEVLSQLDEFYNPSDRLRLVVDLATNELKIVNGTQELIALDSYSLTSSDGLLTGNWSSLASQGVTGWQEAVDNSPQRLMESNSQANYVVAVGTQVSLGSPIDLPAPAALGDEIVSQLPLVELTYNNQQTGDVTVAAEFVGVPDRHNNLVMTIDPTTGATSIHNDSPYFDATIVAYTITSATGRLQSDSQSWNSLEAQGVVGWQQADNSNLFRLTEFNPLGELALEIDGTVYYMGQMVDVTGTPLAFTDFTYEFLLASGTILTGVVELGPLPGLSPGDFDGNGTVDQFDYALWRASFGSTILAGTGADGNGDGFVDLADYVVWRDGLTQASLASSVAEPGSAFITILAVSTFAFVRRLPRRIRFAGVGDI